MHHLKTSSSKVPWHSVDWLIRTTFFYTRIAYWNALYIRGIGWNQRPPNSLFDYVYKVAQIHDAVGVLLSMICSTSCTSIAFGTLYRTHFFGKQPLVRLPAQFPILMARCQKSVHQIKRCFRTRVVYAWHQFN